MCKQFKISLKFLESNMQEIGKKRAKDFISCAQGGETYWQNIDSILIGRGRFEGHLEKAILIFIFARWSKLASIEI